MGNYNPLSDLYCTALALPNKARPHVILILESSVSHSAHVYALAFCAATCVYKVFDVWACAGAPEMDDVGTLFRSLAVDHFTPEPDDGQYSLNIQSNRLPCRYQQRLLVMQ